MSWDLVRDIQTDTDVRLILPFGLALRLGDVVSVGRDGAYSLEGSSASLLGQPPGSPRAGGAVDIGQLSGHGVSCTFRAAGSASTLFPELPHATAGLDIAFSKKSGWALAMTGRALLSLQNVNRYREPILDAYRRKVWKPDWALVTMIGDAERMTLLAARDNDTKVALSLNGTVAATAGLDVQLTSDVAIAATNQEITHCVTTTRMPVACRALRVRDPWWRSPYVSDLAWSAPPASVHEAADDAFWEDVDAL
jgi:hypothetical protein